MSDPSVFMIGWEYPPHNSGGLGVACEGLTKALAGKNTQIYFTLPYSHTDHLDHLQVIACVDPTWETLKNQPPFLAYSASKPQLSQSLNANELHTLPSSELEWRVDQYRELVVQEADEHQKQFDVIHAHDWMTFPAAAQAKNELGKPVVAHVHSTEFDRIPGGTGSAYIHQTEYEGLQAADKIIAVSAYTKHLLVQKYQVDPAKISVVYNGVPEIGASASKPPAAFAATRPVVVFMGRLTMQKGPEQFLSVAQKVLARVPDALFIIAGQGDMYRQLLLSTATQGMTASVLFTGFVRGADREALLDRADVFVMPSLSEPFGLVAVEAAQRHTPVIVSKTSGVSEVLPSAIALDFWDRDAMVQTITGLLANRPARQVVVRKQLKDLRQTSWSQAADQVKSIYQSVA